MRRDHYLVRNENDIRIKSAFLIVHYIHNCSYNMQTGEKINRLYN